MGFHVVETRCPFEDCGQELFQSSSLQLAVAIEESKSQLTTHLKKSHYVAPVGDFWTIHVPKILGE